MTHHSRYKWGFFGITAVFVGIGSWFVGGMPALVIGLIAVAFGFFGSKNHNRLSQAGMIFGAFSVLFINCLNLNILPIPASLVSDKSHIITSIHASIRAFGIFNGKKLSDQERIRLIRHFQKAIEAAAQVDMKQVGKEIPGFADHYKTEFVGGMQSLIEGYENDDLSKKLSGGLLLDKWAIWNRDNKESLGRLKEPSPSLAAYLKAAISG
jgi:hypothetical protein